MQLKMRLSWPIEICVFIAVLVTPGEAEDFWTRSP